MTLPPARSSAWHGSNPAYATPAGKKVPRAKAKLPFCKRTENQSKYATTVICNVANRDTPKCVIASGKLPAIVKSHKFFTMARSKEQENRVKAIPFMPD